MNWWCKLILANLNYQLSEFFCSADAFSMRQPHFLPFYCRLHNPLRYICPKATKPNVRTFITLIKNFCWYTIARSGALRNMRSILTWKNFTNHLLIIMGNYCWAVNQNHSNHIRSMNSRNRSWKHKHENGPSCIYIGPHGKRHHARKRSPSGDFFRQTGAGHKCGPLRPSKKFTEGGGVWGGTAQRTKATIYSPRIGENKINPITLQERRPENGRRFPLWGKKGREISVKGPDWKAQCQ